MLFSVIALLASANMQGEGTACPHMKMPKTCPETQKCHMQDKEGCDCAAKCSCEGKKECSCDENCSCEKCKKLKNN